MWTCPICKKEENTHKGEIRFCPRCGYDTSRDFIKYRTVSPVQAEDVKLRLRGQMVDGSNGQGIMYYTDGGRYDGEWYNGKRDGHGIHYYENGDVYDGQWRDDVACGYGVYTKSDGQIISGVWEDNCIKIMEKKPQPKKKLWGR